MRSVKDSLLLSDVWTPANSPVCQSSRTEVVFHTSSLSLQSNLELSPCYSGEHEEGGHNDLSEYLPYPESAGCTEAAFWGSHMWACRLIYMCVGAGCWSQRGQGGGRGADLVSESSFCLDSDKVWFSLFRSSTSLKGGSLKFQIRTRLHLACSVYMWWVSLIWLLIIWIWNSQLIHSWIKTLEVRFFFKMNDEKVSVLERLLKSDGVIIHFLNEFLT